MQSMKAVDAPTNEALAVPKSYEIEEFETFCEMFSLNKQEALPELEKLKIFLNTDGNLGFERLKGGDCNAPILVCTISSLYRIPVAVLKHEPDSSWAEDRMCALDKMKNDGFEQLPQILKDIKGNYVVTLGGKAYSCIQYLEPDPDQSSSIEQMFTLTSNFHAYSKRISFPELCKRALDTYSNENISNPDPELTKRYFCIFDTESWKICVTCSNYFTSHQFLEVYNALPTQIIHGDITPNNTIISKGKSFFIDFDKVRTDVRLIDFATFCGWNCCFLERYLTLVEKGNLFSFIQTCYGNLEEIEEKHFHSIVLFVRCCVLEWSLWELKRAIQDHDLQKEERFARILSDTIFEINEIYARILMIKELSLL